MPESVYLPPDDIVPDESSVLKAQKLPVDTTEDSVRQRFHWLYTSACAQFVRYARPRGLIAGITHESFSQVFNGEGLNETPNPLSDIFPKAEQIALFAVTLGQEVSIAITDLFNSNDFALGYMLDAVCSEAAERTADAIQNYYAHVLVRTKAYNYPPHIVRYSPGFCGWHISGQKKIFEYLLPQEIGITLNQNYLMQPLKSISGVLVVGKPEIHQFAAAYPFCATCTHRSCRERMRVGWASAHR